MIEPHKNLLNQPEDETLLYKVISSKNFFKMIESNCLHFKRVDTYTDDTRDSAQPDRDLQVHDQIHFENYASVKLSKYYNRCRSRTYACCFSTKNTLNIWDSYSGGDENSICIVFHFGRLKEKINSFYESNQVLYMGKRIQNFFDINYGNVIYGDFRKYSSYSSKDSPYSCPIKYAYFKDRKYHKDQELRITLSASGAYEKFVLPDSTPFDFPESIGLEL